MPYPCPYLRPALRRLAALALLTVLALGTPATAATPSIATLAQPATVAAGPSEAGDEPVVMLKRQFTA